MNYENLEIGIQRLFYVAWASFALWAIGYSIYFISVDRIEEALYRTSIGVVLPGIVMLAVRWIYRGFKPKAETESAI